MSRNYTYDYYNVSVPSDLFKDDPERLAQQAIVDVSERTRLYAMPAEWVATLINDNGYEATFKVRRRRRRIVK